MTMKSNAMIFWRPLSLIIILGISSYVAVKLCLMVKKMEHADDKSSHILVEKTISEVENIARSFNSMADSTYGLATILSSSLNGTQLSYDVIEAKAAPNLFLVLVTVPYLTHVSVQSLNCLFYSFNNNEDGNIYAIYNNNTGVSTWYAQPVNRDTGQMYGVASVANKTFSSVDKNCSLNSNYESGNLVQTWFDQDNELFIYRASMDGRGIISLGLPKNVVVKRFSEMELKVPIFFLASDSGTVIFQNMELPGADILVGNGSVLLRESGRISSQRLYGKRSCLSKQDNHNTDDHQNSGNLLDVNIKGVDYKIHCSTVTIAGQNSVYVLAFPNDSLTITHNTGKFVILLLAVMFVCTIGSSLIYIVFCAIAAKREMKSRTTLVEQITATHQAERKSMNKSLAFAQASHDIRNSLAKITALIDEYRGDAPSSHGKSNLDKIDDWSKDLLGILNSVLDTSKIESGKMTLEEEEFNLSRLLLEVVDLYHYDAIKKGVDVILDPCDGSIFKANSVKGDRLRVKQILCNLISNAVKFTSKGHVVVRAWHMKKDTNNVLVAVNEASYMKWLPRLWYKSNERPTDRELKSIKKSREYLEYVFEVDDTGQGIPVCQQKSVFENFMQVEYTGLGKEGTGLGLGIVQSLVRLMGGEIAIVDKEGENGTCFRFNIFLAAQETFPTERGNCLVLSNPQTFSDLHIVPQMSRAEMSHVVICISGNERRKIIKKFIENFGIQVSIVNEGKDLYPTLEWLKHKLDYGHSSSMDKNEMRLIDYRGLVGSGSSRLEGEKIDQALPYYRRRSNSRSLIFILVVVDAKEENNCELSAILTRFKKDLRFKVVCLDRGYGGKNAGIPCDFVIHKPLHGERIIEVLKILPEFGGTTEGYDTLQAIQNDMVSLKMEDLVERHCQNEVASPVTEAVHERQMPLYGKNILLVEDDPTLQKISLRALEKVGANVEAVVNGKEALERVCRVMRERFAEGKSEVELFNLILMDCEMPEMDGFEATAKIRIEEKQYGQHIPIIALTGHLITGGIREKMINAGMDFHLEKPLKVSNLLEFIQGKSSSN